MGSPRIESPYGAAKRQRLPYAILRVDGRTAFPKTGNLAVEGPVTREQANSIRRLIVDIVAAEDSPAKRALQADAALRLQRFIQWVRLHSSLRTEASAGLSDEELTELFERARSECYAEVR